MQHAQALCSRAPRCQPHHDRCAYGGQGVVIPSARRGLLIYDLCASWRIVCVGSALGGVGRATASAGVANPWHQAQPSLGRTAAEQCLAPAKWVPVTGGPGAPSAPASCSVRFPETRCGDCAPWPAAGSASIASCGPRLVRALACVAPLCRSALGRPSACVRASSSGSRPSHPWVGKSTVLGNRPMARSAVASTASSMSSWLPDSESGWPAWSSARWAVRIESML